MRSDAEILKREESMQDALQWLEAPYEPRALAWAQGATARSSEILQSLPSYADALNALRALNEGAGQVPAISIAGSQAIRLRKSAEHPKGLLELAPWDGSALGKWRTVLDVGALNASEEKDFHLYWDVKCCVGPDFDRCLLALHEAGGDESELREFDLKTGRFVEDGFVVPHSRSSAAWLDADTLLVAHAIGDARTTVTGWPAEAFVWQRGTPLAEARSIFRMGPENALMLLQPAGNRGQAVIVQAIDYSSFSIHVASSIGTRELDLPRSLKMSFGTNSKHVFAILSEPAILSGNSVPAESVVAAALDTTVEGGTAAFEVVHVPKDGDVVDASHGLAVSENGLALPMRRGVDLRVDVVRHERGAWQVQALTQARSGVTPRVECAGLGSNGFVILSEGFLTPPLQEWVHADGSRVVLDEQPPAFDASMLRVETRQATSRDGQVVDFLLLGPRARPSGPVPTLMTGYGAFGISFSPAYFSSPHGGTYGGASLPLWLARGGALAVPALRGGGEHGAAWHRSAMRDNRQRSYDDFHAVAQRLVEDGYTTSKHLGVFGLSNGGLLAAVAGTQRPELYGAIVSDVPLADMLRFPEMGMGAAWIDEYGDPTQPADARWLAAYSPVHNVRPGVEYPPFLVTVATTDNRVGPGHARKLAMRLMEVGADPMFLEPGGGGHGVSDPLQRPEMMAMRMAFLMDTLLPSQALTDAGSQ